MSMHNHTMTAVSGGNLRRGRVAFLSNDYTVLELSTPSNTGAPAGIIQIHSRKAPGTPFDTSLYAAQSGDEVTIYTDGAIALAECGNTVTAGTRVTSDATARIIDTIFGVPTGTSFGVSWGWEVGTALEDGAAGDVVRIKVDVSRAYRG